MMRKITRNQTFQLAINKKGKLYSRKHHCLALKTFMWIYLIFIPYCTDKEMRHTDVSNVAKVTQLASS